jgi:hypothetical protein
MPPQYESAFRNHGFFWGGRWNSIKDYMHFEWHGINPNGGPVPPPPSTDCQALADAFVAAHPGSEVAVKDLSGDKNCSSNGTAQIQSASLYKLFVAQYLYAHRSEVDLNSQISISMGNDQYNRKEDGRDHSNGQNEDAYWPFKFVQTQNVVKSRCLDLMISQSENACGEAFKSYVSPRQNSFGQSTTLSPQRTTANDVADLLVKVARRQIPGAASLENLMLKQFDRNKLPSGVPSGSKANKTGSIWPGQGSTTNDAMIVRAGGKAYVLVVLSNMNPTLSSTKTAFKGLSYEIYKLMAGT